MDVLPLLLGGLGEAALLAAASGRHGMPGAVSRSRTFLRALGVAAAFAGFLLVFLVWNGAVARQDAGAVAAWLFVPILGFFLGALLRMGGRVPAAGRAGALVLTGLVAASFLAFPARLLLDDPVALLFLLPLFALGGVACAILAGEALGRRTPTARSKALLYFWHLAATGWLMGVAALGALLDAGAGGFLPGLVLGVALAALSTHLGTLLLLFQRPKANEEAILHREGWVPGVELAGRALGEGAVAPAAAAALVVLPVALVAANLVLRLVGDSLLLGLLAALAPGALAALGELRRRP